MFCIKIIALAFTMPDMDGMTFIQTFKNPNKTLHLFIKTSFKCT